MCECVMDRENTQKHGSAAGWTHGNVAERNSSPKLFVGPAVELEYRPRLSRNELVLEKPDSPLISPLFLRLLLEFLPPSAISTVSVEAQPQRQLSSSPRALWVC